MSLTRKFFSYIFFPALAIGTGIFITAFLLNSFQVGALSLRSDLGNSKRSDLKKVNIETISATPASTVGYFIKDLERNPKLTTGAYLIGDIDTGEIIFDKNTDTAFPVASVSKLMTALVALETLEMNKEIKISGRAVNTYGTSGELYAGEKMKISTMLYPLILESSNDAAEAIAETQGRNEFLKAMNEKAEELGMKNTFYGDPSGLSARNVSTVSDLFKLTRYIHDNENQIFEISKKYKMEAERNVWFNNNKLIHQEDYIGGKSGYTDEARKTGIALWNVPITETPEGRNIAVIVLRSSDRFRDTMALVNYTKQNIFYGDKDRALSFVPIEKRLEPAFKNWADLAFVGDIMLDREVKKSVERYFNGDYNALFKNVVDDLTEADIVFGNLVGPISDQGMDSKNLYSFRMDPKALPSLAAAGFDALSVANNHINDWGKPAFDDTLRRLKEANIMPVGGGVDFKETEAPRIIEKNGVQIGFLGFSDVGPELLEASDNRSGILLASNPRFEEIIQNASNLVDVLVVSFNFGVEYEKVTDRQKELAHKAIDAGAKIVAGTRPHVIQDVEEYEDGLILYSLGNFIFDQAFSKETMQGVLAQVRVDKSGIKKHAEKIIKLNDFFQPQSPVELKQ